MAIVPIAEKRFFRMEIPHNDTEEYYLYAVPIGIMSSELDFGGGNGVRHAVVLGLRIRRGWGDMGRVLGATA